MLEKLVGLERMNILQCQEMAKEIGFDSITFDLCGPKRKKKAKWLDAYFGLFEIEGVDGVLMASQFQFSPDVWCENVMLANGSLEPTANTKRDEGDRT